VKGIFVAVWNLVRLRRVRPTGAPIAPGVFIGLVLVALASTLVLDWIATEPPRSFLLAGVQSWSVWVLLLIGLGALAAREAPHAPVGGPLIALLLATGATLDLVQCVVLATVPAASPAVLMSDWLRLVLEVSIATRAIDACTGIGALRASSLGALYGAILLGLSWNLPGEGFWYTESSFEAPRAASFDAEALLHGQADRVRGAVGALAPERPGVADLFLVSVAADATQGVFRREVEYVQSLFAERFETSGHSLLLVNDDAERDAYPLATGSNLADALTGIGARVDRDDDVVFLFLTGHGGPDGRVAVSFPRLPLNDLEPEDLVRALDASGIRWQVVVVSACYSGTFLEPLRHPNRLVITASAADRASFGCSDHAPMTEFGRAFFVEALADETSFARAFESARARVAERERAEKLTPSLPQIAFGDAIAAKLETMEARWRPAPVVTAQAP
jgi:hypothetical protein